MSTRPVVESRILPEWSGREHLVIGMLHAPALPGAPRYGNSMSAIVQHVLHDAEQLAENGVDGLMLENFGDVPFTAGAVEPVTIAALTRLAMEVTSRFPLPLGLNVLRNDGYAALSIAAAVGARFIRVNVLSGARVTDQGVITGEAYRLLRFRQSLGNSQARILADVDVKHSAPLARRPLAEETEELLQRAGADAVVVSGASTGRPVSLTDLPEVAAAASGFPVLVGSGVTVETLPRLLPFCQGVIVGTSLKPGGDVSAAVEGWRVRELVTAVRSASS